LSRDHNVRSRIIAHIAEHGTVADSSGRATAALKEAIRYGGTDAGFTQVIAAMAKAGLLNREIRGKRTYRISNSVNGECRPPGGKAGAMSDAPLDYEELARTLLEQAVRAPAVPRDASGSASWAQRRLDQLEARNVTLQRGLARAKAQAEAMVAERDTLCGQLETVEHNLSILAERSQRPRPPQNGAAQRLAPDEQVLLHQFQRRHEAIATSTERAL